MKKKIFILCLCLFAILYFTSCTSSTNPDPNSQTIKISGNLYLGSIQTSSIKKQSVGTDYLVVATCENGTIRSSLTNSSGSFEINIPKNSPTMISFVNNSTGKYIGTTLFNSQYTALAANQDSSLGDIVLDTTNKYAVTSQNISSSIIDATYKPRLSNHIPVGAGNYGKGSIAAMSISKAGTSSSIDGDTDGTPDLFDADNDGDRILDEFEAISTKATEGIAGSTRIENIVAFPNLKIALSESETFDDPGQTYKLFLAFEIDFANPDNVESIEVVTIPSYASTCKFDQSTAYDFD